MPIEDEPFSLTRAQFEALIAHVEDLEDQLSTANERLRRLEIGPDAYDADLAPHDGEPSARADDDRRAWFEGMAIAGYALSLQSLAILITTGLVEKTRIIELVDESLLQVEEQLATTDRNRAAHGQARFLLERALESLRLVGALHESGAEAPPHEAPE